MRNTDSGSLGTLIRALGPTPQVFTIDHWDGNTFSYTPIGENAVPICAVTFNVGADGRPTSVNVENLNGEPPIDPTLGTFARA